MPRKCTVCSHPEREAIEKALIAGEAPRVIASRYVTVDAGGKVSPLGRMAVQRHKEEHLPAAALKAQEAKDTAHSIDVMAELTQCIERVNLLSDACDRWLRDPDDPTRYDVGPRSEDVTVTYEEEVDGTDGKTRIIRKKAPLSQLLAKLDRTVTAVEVKHADPRELLLKSYDRLQRRLELVAKLLGELDDRPQINVTISPEWLQIRAVIVATLGPYPEARQAVARALKDVEAPNARH